MISSVFSSQPRPPSKGVLLETQVCKALLTGFQARTGGSLGEELAMSPVLGVGEGGGGDGTLAFLAIHRHTGRA